MNPIPVLPAELGLLDDTAWREDDVAVRLVRRYYDRVGTREEFTGAAFDTWHIDRAPDVITADDLLAVTFLSVSVPPRAVRAILDTESSVISGLLTAVGPDRDLAVEPAGIHEDGHLLALWKILCGQVGIGRVTASKILARKRPRLVPVYDSVVGGLTGIDDHYWAAWHRLLTTNIGLHERLLHLRSAAGAPPEVSALRTLDVALWMYATRLVDDGTIKERDRPLRLADLVDAPHG